MNEQFSAFLDNEASLDEADSVISALLTNPQLRESWTRQHWLRTTLRAHRSESAVALDPGFSSRVMQAIAADADREHGADVQPAATLLPARARRRRRRRWRGMAGMAAVASAAGIVLLVGNPLPRSESPAGRMANAPSSTTGSSLAASRSSVGRSANKEGSVPTLASRPESTHTRRVQSIASLGSRQSDRDMLADVSGNIQSTGDARSASQTVGTNTGDSASNHWSVSDPQLQSELNGYLVDHNGLARSYGLSGTTPALVRVATYGQDTTQ